MAAEVAKPYKEDVDPERVPEPEAYLAIAVANDVTLDVYLLLSDELYHFYVNPDASRAVKVFYSTCGGNGIRDGKGHFDFLMTQPLATPTDALALANSAGNFGS